MTVKVYLMGGLGNNLFQINYAYALRAAGINVIINTCLAKKNYLLLPFLNLATHNSLEHLAQLGPLRKFEIDDKFRLAIPLGALSKRYERQLSDVRFFGLETPRNLVELSTMCRHHFGYFHNGNPVSSELFSLAVESLDRLAATRRHLKADLDFLADETNCIIHVRGGDFVKDTQNCLGPQYYSGAIDLMFQRGVREMIVATNDRAYARAVLPMQSVKFTKSESALDDLILIYKAKRKIISNSTFSWWAAELSARECTIVEADVYYPMLEWHPVSGRERVSVARC